MTTPGMNVGAGPTHDEGQSFYDAVGGHATFARIVRTFYEGVSHDAVLRPMYPEDDLEGAIHRLTLFLEQYWGGPTTYSDTRGHPRLRMRHQAFRVNPEARDHWIEHMRHAVATADLSPIHAVTLMDYLERAAHSMINSFEPTPDHGDQAAPRTGADTEERP